MGCTNVMQTALWHWSARIARTPESGMRQRQLPYPGGPLRVSNGVLLRYFRSMWDRLRVPCTIVPVRPSAPLHHQNTDPGFGELERGHAPVESASGDHGVPMPLLGGRHVTLPGIRLTKSSLGQAQKSMSAVEHMEPVREEHNNRTLEHPGHRLLVVAGVHFPPPIAGVLE